MLKIFFKQITNSKIRGAKIASPVKTAPLDLNCLKKISKAIFPLTDKNKRVYSATVKVGDKVNKGDTIASIPNRNDCIILSSISGKVSEVSDQIVIVPNNTEYTFENPEYISINLDNYSKEKIIESIKNADVLGLGGALFPAFRKITTVKNVILNAVECEPTNTADKALLMNYTKEILAGGLLLQKATNAEQVIIAIKYNKRSLIKKIKQTIKNNNEFKNIKIKTVPDIYPAGQARQLVKFIFGEKVPEDVRLTKRGFLVNNVGTAFSIYRATVHKIPQTERIVSVVGKDIKNPTNIITPIGTTLQDIFNHLDISKDLIKTIRLGGLMMGEFIENINDLNKPLLKNTSAIIINLDKSKSEGDCLNCGKCVQVCPLGLKPNKMIFTFKNKEITHKDLDFAEICINCNLCSYLCPANIDVAKTLNKVKKIKVEIQEQQEHQEYISNLIEKKKQRVKKEKADKEAKRKARLAQRKAKEK